MERIGRLLGVDGTTMSTVRRAELAVLRTLQAKGDAAVPASLGAEHKTGVQLLHDAGLAYATYVLGGDIRVRLTPAGLAPRPQPRRLQLAGRAGTEE